MKGYENYIRNQLTKLEASGARPENVASIKRYDQENAAQKKTGSTRFNLILTARQLAEAFPSKTFEQIDKADITAFLKGQDARYKWKTQLMYRINVKAFYKWLEGEGEDYPKKVKWIATSGIESRKVQPSDMPTPADMDKMIKSCGNPRDRLIISLLGEIGFRAGELESIRLCDIQFNDGYAVVTARGKTGQRTLRVYDSEPLLKLVYSMHPLLIGDAEKDRYNEAPLFVSVNRSNKGKPLGYGGLLHVIKDAAARAGLKNVHPHLFRHMALTRMGKHMKDAELRVFAGWSGGSRQAKTYIHLTSEDIMQRQGEIAGDVPVKSEKTDYRPQKACARCKTRNDGKAMFCASCGAILDKSMRDAAEAQRMGAEVKLRAELDEMKKDMARLIAAVEKDRT